MDVFTAMIVASPFISLALYILASAIEEARKTRKLQESNRRNGLV